MAKPTILFTPGAWHSPAHYEKIMTALQQHGYETEAVALATVDPKDPPNTHVDDDVQVISNAINKILLSGKDVVLVSHSYSGIPAQSAAYSFLKQDQNGPRLKAIAMMCSFLYPPKTALLAATGGKPLQLHVVSADETLVDVSDDPGPEVAFYSDVSPEEAAAAKAMLKSHSWRSKTLPPSAEGVGYWEIPTSYLVCENDKALPADLQRKWITDANEALKARGTDLRIREEQVESGHSPFLSKTEQTAAFIRRAAGEDVPVS
ncbi:hypothetical protein A1O7_10047 [Cladophialophora yegresii CBS 114405]|uniref:AB hydrolase-1 domain-containing protein n=1 Tax=Cladophialophora yegresii CBS 114405 TaxID=1182544 RepID=W9VRB7_9EURO|nr:uncharacterized protein A1O7_10047 [Cladophialophora yegresii CBS 114405]EXJ54706.1 hypothetical protein A1O7_10047 [Cladophialophora yegresii CBS 114405]